MAFTNSPGSGTRVVCTKGLLRSAHLMLVISPQKRRSRSAARPREMVAVLVPGKAVRALALRLDDLVVQLPVVQYGRRDVAAMAHERGSVKPLATGGGAEPASVERMMRPFVPSDQYR